MPRPSLWEGRGLCQSHPHLGIEIQAKSPPLKSIKDRAPKNPVRNSVLTYGNGIIRPWSAVKKKTKGRATLYDVVGSVKRHFEFASFRQLVLVLLKRAFAVCFILTKARCLNLAVESGSTSHLFGLGHPTMIHFSDAAIARGSKAPNQPSDELASTRVAPGLPCLRTSRA